MAPDSWWVHVNFTNLLAKFYLYYFNSFHFVMPFIRRCYRFFQCFFFPEGCVVVNSSAGTLVQLTMQAFSWYSLYFWSFVVKNAINVNHSSLLARSRKNSSSSPKPERFHVYLQYKIFPILFKEIQSCRKEELWIENKVPEFLSIRSVI